MLNLKRLQYLDAVYQYKNFTQASEALYVSQPAISSAVQALEEELGVRLVVRSSKGVTFTYEGEQFMIWARRILSTCEAAENAMRDLAGTAEQRLRLGISHVLTNPIVPMIFSTFLREHPKAQIYLNEGSMNKHVEMVKCWTWLITPSPQRRRRRSWRSFLWALWRSTRCCIRTIPWRGWTGSPWRGWGRRSSL